MTEGHRAADQIIGMDASSVDASSREQKKQRTIRQNRHEIESASTNLESTDQSPARVSIPLPQPRSLRTRSRRRCSLRLEPLEARRLLAGIQVAVFVDSDASRSYDEAADVAAADRLVYVDLNSNSKFDTGEPVSVTDVDGHAFFANLEDGEYRIGLITNPRTQAQTTATQVSAVAELRSESSAAHILTGPETGNVWMVDDSGKAQLLDGDQQVDMGGRILSSSPHANSWLLVLESTDPSTQQRSTRLVRFDADRRDLDEIGFPDLQDGTELVQVLGSQGGPLALLRHSDGHAVVKLELDGQLAYTSRNLVQGIEKIAASPADQTFVTTRANNTSADDDGFDGNTSIIALHNASGEIVDIRSFNSHLSRLQYSADGSFVFAASDKGGIQVFSTTENELRLEAILEDAAFPISAASVDGRILTSKLSDRKQVVSWDSNSWAPIGTSELPTALAADSSLTTDKYGDRATVGISSGVYQIELNAPRTIAIEVSGGTSSNNTKSGDLSEAVVRIGVRPTGRNAPPATESFAPRKILEDDLDALRLNESDAIYDDDGDQLWFTLETSPNHGDLSFDPLEGWNYVPNENYFGEDRAILRVHDGIDSSELVLQWEIAPVNDPPLAIHIQIPAIEENPQPGTSVGYISVSDPDPGASYRITTSDPRFQITGGQIIFVDGELDFDAEPNINFHVIATDTEAAYAISSETTLQLIDVNEPPVSIDLDSRNVAENESGVRIGRLSVLDPDAESHYELSVSDDRFELQDGELRLKDGVGLDYESEPEVPVAITARDSHSDDIWLTETITLTVQDTNDAPTDLEVGGDEVRANHPGGLIGRVAVADEDGEPYDYEVSDDRFEVVNGYLKLRDDQYIEPYEPIISMDITGVSPQGDRITRRLPITILPPRPPHQNPVNPKDVNGDGSVTPLDALEIINDLNEGRGGVLPPRSPIINPDSDSGESGPIYPDVNGDGVLSPMDVLELINELNRDYMENETSPDGEGPSIQFVNSSDLGPAVQTPYVYGPQLPRSFEFDSSDRKRQADPAAIDSELEQLLDQLSRQRHHDQD